MKGEAEAVDYARSVVVLGVICLLLTLASVLLFVAVGFGFAAGEITVNPNAARQANAHLNRAANLSLALFAVVLMALATVVVRAGVLGHLHWAARAAGAFIIGAILSYLIVVTLGIGGLPYPLDNLSGILAKWIQAHV